MFWCCISYFIGWFYLNELILSVCVCGDDHVTCYMGANVDAGEQTGA